MTAATLELSREPRHVFWGLVATITLATLGAQARAQTSPGMIRTPAPAVSRPAPSAWPVYHAARVQGNYDPGTQSGYAATAYGAHRYERVYPGWQNPWYGAEYYNFLTGRGADAAPAPSSVTVIVSDPQAVVTFQGWQTATKGTKRSYKTPPLAPGALYEYDVVARWRQNGAEVEKRRTVDVAAGGSVTIDFTKPDAPGL